MKQDWEPGTLIYPLPAVLVSCGNSESEYSILTVAWIGTICANPPMCYIPIRPERCSYPITKENIEFVINLTARDMTFAIDWCGVRSGKDYRRFEEVKLTPGKCTMVSTPLTEESPLCIRYRMKRIVSLGSYDMLIADVINIRADNHHSNRETGKLELTETNPPVCIYGGYYSLGKKISRFGWSVGKKTKRGYETSDSPLYIYVDYFCHLW